MDKLIIYVCENLVLEYIKALETEGFEDVEIRAFKDVCQNQKNLEKNISIFRENQKRGETSVLLCSKDCLVSKTVKTTGKFKFEPTNCCFSHLASEEVTDYIQEKGGMFISLGFLENWKAILKLNNFTQEKAREFYHNKCREMIFFDTGILAEADKKINELSQYLDLAIKKYPCSQDGMKLILRSVVYQWRAQSSKRKCEKSMADMQAQCAEYSAVLDMMGRISASTVKSDAIDKIRVIFFMIFGAQKFNFWDWTCKDEDLSSEIKELLEREDLVFQFFREKNKVCIKIQRDMEIYGVIEVSDFLYPQYFEKYVNLIMETIKIFGLVLSNIDQYENLKKSKNVLEHISYHDSLTELHNRAFVNKIIEKDFCEPNTTFFNFDIDRLKYVNDTFGHIEGDKLLINTARILKKCFRESDIVARIGGDEFLAILYDCDKPKAEMFKRRIDEAIFNYNCQENHPHLRISLSYGYATSNCDEHSVEKLILKTDELMYSNKSLKRTLL